MSQSPQPKTPTRGVAELLDSLVASDGTGAHPHVRSGALSSGPEAMRNLADAVHFLCLLHGRHPGVIDNAARKAVDPASRRWMDEAADAFVQERAFLSKIASAVGPVPSTQGQAQCEAAVAAQRKALDMLAESDRHGCALGAAIALTLDWRTIRVLLDISALRLDLVPPTCTLPDLLVDQGDADNFLAEQLKTELLVEACERNGQKADIRMQPGYDHSYYFISTFMAEHVAWHAERLKA